AGFTVATQGNADYREENIELPDGWLRGFMQTQAAMTLPARRVTLTREAVYSILAFLKRHKARKSPRALRFEMVAGKPPSLVLEPWEQRVPVYGEPLRTSSESIRICGRQRFIAGVKSCQWRWVKRNLARKMRNSAHPKKFFCGSEPSSIRAPMPPAASSSPAPPTTNPSNCSLMPTV